MSLTITVTVHCDTCSDWVIAADHPARVRRKRGWVIYRDAQGHRRDRCPKCAGRPRA